MTTEIKKTQIPKGPEGEKDPNDWALKGQGRLKEAMEEIANPDPFGWTRQFTMTKEEAAKIADPEWIIPNLVIRGHLIVVPAEPNGGKTTILWHLSREMVAKGFHVHYVNADISGADAKRFVMEASQYGIDLLLPDMKGGMSMNDVVIHLINMNGDGGDFSSHIFIFDTLKKMTDVINKSKAKGLYKTLRSLTAKGMTVIALAHTNKYRSEDGKPIFEGTGDLRSDFDELIYLIPQKHPDGSMTVSTEPDKVRGAFEPITFNISPAREVSQTEYVDVAEESRRQAQRERDQPTIEAINIAIESGKNKQVEIISACKELKVSRRSVQAVLKRYSYGEDRIWDVDLQMQNNTRCYWIRKSIPGGI